MEGFLLLNVSLLQSGDVGKLLCRSTELHLKQIMKMLK